MKAQDHDLQIEAAAARWDVRLRSHACTDADRAEFRAWCNADTRHQETFDRLQLAVNTLRQAADHPQVRALRERAEILARRSSRRRAITRLSLAAGIAAVAIGLGALVRHLGVSPSFQSSGGTSNGAEQAYVTGAWERRVVQLPDGSSATLNAGTRLQTAWFPHERQIHLISGEALFSVAKDPARPFVVTAGDHTVTALGTEFDVRLEHDKVLVTLLEGHLAIRGLGLAARQPALELVPNEKLIAITGQLPTIQIVDAARSVDWAKGQVFFTDESLPAAVAKMNRYGNGQIVVGDPSLARYRINGMFRSGDQEGFVDALTTYYPIAAHRDTQGRIVLTPLPKR
jgi:transmembrane sensor